MEVSGPMDIDPPTMDILHTMDIDPHSMDIPHTMDSDPHTVLKPTSTFVAIVEDGMDKDYIDKDATDF
jgi:hypothetical protein